MINLFPIIQEKLLACYFPTSVLFVDDSKDFLKTIDRIVNPMLSHNVFDNTTSILEYLTNDYMEDSFTKRCLKVYDSDNITHKSLDIDLGIISQEIYNNARFKQVSVLCVDHSMPKMTGIELCQKIKKLNIKKILLTGVAGSSEAVDAFNAGLIDCYIVKGSTDWEKKLHNAIFELQYEYFAKKSNIITDSVIELCGLGVSCLDDPIFINVFEKFAKEINALEYYLHDETGSYFFLDFNGKPSYLVIKNEEQMDDFYEVCLDWELPAKLTNAVKNREMIAYFHNEEDYNVKDLAPFFHKALPLKGAKANFYYSLITNSSLYNIQPEKIISYKNFLKQK